jgi:thioredoxin reductase (NADPH)
VFLSRWARHVHVLLRGDRLAAGMSDYLVGQLEAVPERITVHAHTEVTAVGGERHLDWVTWTDRRSGEQETRPVAALFLMLGAVPSTEWLRDAVALDDKGFVCTGPDVGGELLETNRPGVFAVGDVRAGSVKRVAAAVGEGAIVIASVHQRLGEAAVPSRPAHRS